MHLPRDVINKLERRLARATILMPPADLSCAALTISAIDKLGEALSSACILLAASDLSLPSLPYPAMQCRGWTACNVQAALC